MYLKTFQQSPGISPSAAIIQRKNSSKIAKTGNLILTTSPIITNDKHVGHNGEIVGDIDAVLEMAAARQKFQT